jgi:hypothetical protein
VHHADHRERELAARHQLHRQREGEHVRVGGRQRVAQAEAADAVVLGEVLAVHLEAGQPQLHVRQHRPAGLHLEQRHPVERRAPGDPAEQPAGRAQRRARVEHAHPRLRVELANLHQAPISA